MQTFNQHINEKRERVMYSPPKSTRIDMMPGLHNPKTEAEITGLLNRSRDKTLRFILIKDTKDVYVWDADKATHADVAIAYGYEVLDPAQWDWGLVFASTSGETIVDVGFKRTTLPLLSKLAPGFKKFISADWTP